MVIFSESSKMPIARGTRPKSIEIFLKKVIQCSVRLTWELSWLNMQAVTLADSISNPSKIPILVHYSLN